MVHSTSEFDFTALSPLERLQLAQALLESVLEADANPFTPEQVAELQRRLDDIDAGRGSFEPWESVRERLLLKR
jgi:putative addiction module component (TIGR02574 family)